MEELLTNTESQDSPIKKKTLNTEGVDLSVFQRKPLEETAIEQSKPKKTLNTEGVDVSVFNKPKKLNTEGVDMSKFDLHKDVFTLTPSMIEQINQKSGSKFSTAGKDVMRYNSLDPHIIKAANAKKEDPNLIKFLMLQESRMRPGQTSSMGYYGLAQTNKATIETVNKNFGTKYTIKDMDDPEQAAMFIADYLKLARKFGAETWEEYIVAYNRGIGHVKTHKAGGEHPKETQGYLKTGTAVKDSLDEIARRREAEQKPEEKQELYIFDEAQEKYRVAPREKNIAFASGVSDVIVDAVQKYRQKIPKAQGGQFKYDTLSSRLNGFIEMFPEMAEEAKALREEMSKGVGVDALAGIEDRMKALEEKVSGVQEPTTMYVPGTGDMMQMFSRKNQHPNWDKYEQTIVNNPATRATQGLLENTAKMNDIMQMEETKRGTLVGRFGKGIIDGVIDEAEGYLKLGETIENNIYITRLVNKLNKAAESEDTELDFTPEEAHLLRALFENVDARERLDPQRFNSAYNWGLGFGKNMSFMAEFALTGGIRKVTQEAVERAVTRGIIGGAKNITVPQHVLARLAGIGVQSAYMPRVWRNAAEEASNGVPPGQALWNSYYENFTEVLSENLYTGKIVDGMHLNWYDQTMSKMGHALAGRRGMSGVMRALGEEFLEEKFAELAMAAKEHPNPKQFWLEFLPVTKEGVKSNLHTLGSVAIMTGILGSPAIVGDTSSSVWNKIKLNKIGKDLDAKIKGDIDIILDSGDKTSVAETYAMIFKRVRQAVEGNEIQGDLTQEVIKALNYAVEKTRNIALEHYADTKAFDDYRKVSAFVKNIPVKNEGAFREALAEAGIQLPANAKFGDIAENEALLTPEKDRTPEQKKFVQQINAALEAYKQKAKDVSEQGKMQAEAKDLQETIDFDTKQKARMEEGNKWAQERIDILNQKPELTEQEQTELKTLGTLIAENLKKLSDLETSMPENQKRLTEINTLLSEKQQVDVQEDTEKSPKSETDAEGTLTKKETDIAEKARIVPKTFADLKRVGTEVFGLNKIQANAFAIITDRLIRNQAKRAGVSVEEMYATYDFRKADAKDLAEFVAEKDKASTEKQAQGARGAFILDNGKRVIFALTNPNVSTPMHEMAHAFEAFLTDAEKAMVLKWAGAKNWDVNTSEKFAKGFEKYLQEGKAPTPELAKVFENFKKWLLSIYNDLAGAGLDVKLNDKMRSVYDSMLAETQERSKTKSPEGLSKRGEALFQAIGENANLQKNVRDNLAVARQMEAAGESVKDIRIATGWERGVDKKWRYEIPDEIGDFVKKFDEIEGFNIFSGNKAIQEMPLGELLGDVPLFKYYPKLKDVKVTKLIHLGDIFNSTQGWYNPDTNTLNITPYSKDKEGTLIHEIQHAIQEIEGFAKGEIDAGNIDYRRTAGEVEARNVQERAKMTPEQRRQTTLQETEDVVRDEQIILFQGAQQDSKTKDKEGEALFQTIKVDGVDTKVKPVNADVVNGFYSPLEKVINETKLEKLPAKQWLDKFGRGEEAKWTGLQDWLIQQTGSISKSDIQKFLKENRVQIVEKVKGERTEYIDDVERELDDIGIKLREEKDIERRAKLVKRKLELESIYDEHVAKRKESETVYSDKQLEGESENYKEVLVLMPEKQMKLPDGYSTVEKDGLYQIRDKNNKLISQSRNVDWATEEAIKYIYRDKKSTPFISSHFEEPNILVHLRMNTRKDVDGNKVLFLEEIQSDWGQKGRREGFAETEQEYKVRLNNEIKKQEGVVETEMDIQRNLTGSKKEDHFNNVLQVERARLRKLKSEGLPRKQLAPAAPFVTDTNSWIKLGFKVALKEAVNQKVKKIAWTTGEQQNDRYDLSKQVDWIDYGKNTNGTYWFTLPVEYLKPSELTEKELENYVGKDVARRMVNGEGKYSSFSGGKRLEGDQLKVGGSGMKAFYGDGKNIGIVGKVIESVTKQKVGETKIKDTGTQHSIEITPDLTQQVETGLPLFQTTPDLASKFPAQENADNQKKQDRILTKTQNDFDAAVKYISDVINKQPEEAQFVTYNGKTYAVIPTKVAGRKGYSVVNMEDKGKSGKGVIVGTGFIKKNVLSAAENPANTMTREEALGRIQAYLEDSFTKDAQAKIDKNIAKIKPAAKEKESVEVKPISSVEDLIDRIKIERNAVKDFQKVIEAVRKMIVISKSKKFITPGQFNSIMRRLQYLETDKDRSAALDYVQDIVLGAHYKDQLSQARTFIKQLKKATDKLGEGIKDLQGKTIRAIAKEIIALDPKTMTVEDLEEFNRVAAEIDIRSANPRMWPFQQLSNIIDRIEETDAEAKEVTTEDIVEAIEDYRKKYTKETLVDRKTIVAAQRALARIRNKATDLLIKAYEANTTTAEGATTELGQLISEIGKLEDGRIQGGEIQEMIEQEKKNYIQQVKDNLKKFEKEINYTLSKLNEYKKKHALSLMGTTVSDLEKLNLAQVEMFDRFIYNLAHGYMTPAAASLEIEIGRNRIKDRILTKFFSNVKNSKQFNQWVDKYYNGGSSKLWSKDGRKFKPKLKWRNFNVQQLLQEQIWSRQAHRIDTWLGNYDKDHAIGSVYNFIGRGVSTESITSKKYDERLYTAWNNLLAHYSATMRGEIVYEKPANRRKREQMMSWIGMVLTEKSYQAMDVYDIENVNEKNVSIMHNNYGDETSNLEHNTQEPDKKKFRGNTENYKAFMDMLRKRGATKTVKANKIKGDGTVDIEVMDVEKAEQILREIKPVSKYIDTMYEILEDMRGMAEWSAYANGRGFVGLDSYMPFFVIRNNKMLDVDKIRDSMNIGRRPAKMQAGATYERTGDVNYIEIDPQTIMKRYIQEISRNYHVYGEIKKAVGAVMDAGNEAIQEEIDAKSDKPIMRELTKVIVADMKLRLDNFYGMNSFTRRNSGFRAVVKSVKIGLLSKIHRPLAEFGANAPRAIISIGALPMDAIKDFKQNKEAYELLIEDFIGERYISRWGEEIRGDVFRSKVPKALEQGARWIVTWADTAVGRPLFVHEFRANFKALSGQEFDAARFQTDITYRVDNESYIERAATRGVRKVEELFNEKAPITAPTHIRFWGGLFTPRVDSPMAQYFGFLMSFNRNEMAQVADSIRRIRFSPYREDKAQGYRDLFAITASNAMYGIFRHASMILVEGAGKLVLSTLTGDDGDDERFDARRKALAKWSFYADKLTGSLIELGLGGSAPLSLYAYKVMMAIMDKGKILTEEQRQKIKDYMAAELYVRHIPERGRREDIISAALPVPSALTDEIFRFEGDLVDAISILGIVDREVTDEQQKMAIISLFLTGLKFGMPNPVTPTMQHIFEKERRRRLAELKNQGSENPELDLFNEMYENTFDDDMLYEEIEQLEQFNDLFE
jgi:hypothetical protein